MMSATGKNSGFTLVEIMVSVAILSLGLIVILQGFAGSLNILRVCRNNLEASLFAEEKMAELEINIKQSKNAFINDLSGATQVGNLGLQWQIVASPDLEYKDLNKILATISWKEGKRKGINSLNTFLIIPHAE